MEAENNCYDIPLMRVLFNINSGNENRGYPLAVFYIPSGNEMTSLL